MTAFGGTAAVFLGMATLSSRHQARPVGMGKWLFIGALMLLVGEHHQRLPAVRAR